MDGFIMQGVEILPCYDFQIAIPQGDWMYDDLRSTGEYEPYVIRPFLEKVANRKVLDVGANVGVFSIAASKTARSVQCVEASPENAKFLACNATMNGADNITIFPVAASDRTGMATFHRSQDSNKTLREIAITPDTIGQIDVVFSTTLDALVDEADVIKIDIEGREFAALKGAGRLISQRPVAFVEFSPVFMRHGCDVDAETFWTLFPDYQITILHRDMSQETTTTDRLMQVWADYMSRNVTHVDLMLTPTA